MPVTIGQKTAEHRDILPDFSSPFNALVARPVNRAEIAKTPAAQKALDIEWHKLIAKHVWDESVAFEWHALAEKARATGAECHVGRVFEICVEKGSEYPDGDPRKKFKGRSVFQGNHVRDQHNDHAMFQELGSSPASMQAAKLCDSWGLLPGHTTQQADAEAAYVHAPLTGPPTYVRLPPDRLPPQFRHMPDPVFRLQRALYGHPDSGGHWEHYCETILKDLGWTALPGAWRSTFIHKHSRAILVLYADDFRMAGDAKLMPALWKAIRKRITLSEPTPSEKFLGCDCKQFTHVFPAGGNPWQNPAEIPKGTKMITAQCMEYDMQPFLEQCVESYCTLAGVQRSSLKNVPTPFIDEAKADRDCEAAISAKLDELAGGNPKQLGYDEWSSRIANRSDAYESADAALGEGVLKSVASKILMKILYGARFARSDLLRAVGALACQVTKWTRLCDKKLLRLVNTSAAR